MKSGILGGGLLGGVVLFVWLIVSHGMLPFKSSATHNTLPEQMSTHAVLKEQITEPGIYVCPYLSNEEQAQYPNYRAEPIFEIVYRGETHGTGSSPLRPAIAAIFLGPLLAAWLLAQTSTRIRRSYARRVGFVTMLGVFLAVFGDWLPTLYDSQPVQLTLFFVVNSVVSWLLAGLVIAWRVGPVRR